jgi:nitroreductase
MAEALHLVDLDSCRGEGICVDAYPENCLEILAAAATAPMLMPFYASRKAMSYEENAHLVCHHAMLAAVSLGLGTTIIGLIPPIVDRSRTLRERYGIPRENKVITSLILGYPKYRYKRSIHRDLASVRVM